MAAKKDSEIFDRLRKVEQAQGMHEAVCAERYQGILDTHAEMKAGMTKTNDILLKLGLSILGTVMAIFIHQFIK
jgi:hypothetical protein